MRRLAFRTATVSIQLTHASRVGRLGVAPQEWWIARPSDIFGVYNYSWSMPPLTPVVEWRFQAAGAEHLLAKLDQSMTDRKAAI